VNCSTTTNQILITVWVSKHTRAAT